MLVDTELFRTKNFSILFNLKTHQLRFDGFENFFLLFFLLFDLSIFTAPAQQLIYKPECFTVILITVNKRLKKQYIYFLIFSTIRIKENFKDE